MYNSINRVIIATFPNIIYKGWPGWFCHFSALNDFGLNLWHKSSRYNKKFDTAFLINFCHDEDEENFLYLPWDPV